MSESSYSVDGFLTPNSSDSAEFDEFISSKKQKLEDMCHICNQCTTDPDTKLFQSLPDSAVEEEVALTDDRLLLYGDGELIPDVDAKPLVKITYFAIYDGEGHLCPFDGKLIEREKLLFFSGYMKPIHDDDPSPTGGVPAQELGPILEWWIAGFDGGNSFLLGLSTPCADYILMEPVEEYATFMRRPKQKALLSKIVIEFLRDNTKATYEDLLSRIDEVSVPDDIEPLSEHCLEKYAQFIINQIREIDDKKQLIATPAAQHIIKKYKVKVGNLGCRKKLSIKSTSKPTTTELVRKSFRFYFNTPKEDDTVEETFSEKLSKFTWEVGDDTAVVNDEPVRSGDFVYINLKNKARIFMVAYFFQNNFTKQVHCTELIKGTDTVLGEASNPKEYFFLEECGDWPICKIIKKANLKLKEPPKIWEEFVTHKPDIEESSYFVQKTYSKMQTFEDIQHGNPATCGVCMRAAEREKLTKPVPVIGINKNYDKIEWKGEEYTPGCCVFLEPFCIVFNTYKSSQRIEKTLFTLKVNEVIFPEFYRKGKEFCSLEECPEPFAIGYLKKIFSRKEGNETKLFVTINKFYRPENTKVIKPHDKDSLDLQLLYWSDEEADVAFEHVRGLCDVTYSKTAPSVGLHPQFYFCLKFDAHTKTFHEMDEIPIKRIRRKKPSVTQKLQTLNPFSGCGGLAEGLRQSGLADIAWAIEIDKVTSKAYKSNFPEVVMFEKNCNLFLMDIMSGKLADENGNLYPTKGEVEFLCGGPPCQGFSTLNRFSYKEDSQNNNSLILTYLSLCDYYRPKFFLLENVRNFLFHKKSAFFKHTLSCLIAMGYQCRFGVMQAGNFGLPQARRRVFIIAAAPGLPLPEFPEPTHVFFNSGTECESNGLIIANDNSITSNSAPYRHVTVFDAISNLCQVGNLADEVLHEEPTYYEKFLMSHSHKIQDHLTKEVSPINEARIKHIPASKGCDWRDLPNIQVRLRDGTLTDKLKYSYHDRKNGKSCCGMLRGVCRCASGMSCDPKDRQNNTLIPWFLVHTANRNHNWSGLYGRLDWDGVFGTVTTNPEPANQQGKVLHPEQNRIVSVRECARAQGFPDSFKFQGTVLEKFKQVGNAVPPPLARALGCVILSSLNESISH